jgi:competence ComEA-like helix-hairpin-helix protein
MFNLEKRERLIILFLAAMLLTGISIMLYQKYNSITDVKIRSFDYEPSPDNVKKININEADEAVLTGLPGVGKSVAGRIIEYRDKVGRFSSIEEIKNVKGIKNGLFEKIKYNITIE